MARSTSFGDILRQARIRQGLDVNSVARRLRVRPDILTAIEDSDFSLMPPRGYSKSMITGYARLLGLDSGELVRMYQDELYAYEIGRVRTNNARTSNVMQSQTRQSGRPASSNRPSRASRNDAAQDPAPSSSTRSRTRFIDEPAARQARTASVEEQPKRGRSTRTRVNFGEDQQSEGRTYGQNRVHTSRNVSLPNSQYTNLVASPKNVRQSGSKLPFIIAAVAVLLVLLLAFFIFGGKDDNDTEELPDVPVSGLTDTSNPVEETANIPTPPTDCEFEFEILEGEEAYYELYVDGAEKPSAAGTLTGPTSERYDVSGTLRFVTARPSSVVATVNGEPVTLTDEDGNGVYEYTVDFSKILAQWQADNQAAIDAANAAAQQSADADAEEGTGEDAEQAE